MKKSKTSLERRPRRSLHAGVMPLARNARIRASDLWRGCSGKIHKVAEYEIGKTVGQLYDRYVSKTFCTYLRKRHNADLRQDADNAAWSVK